MKSEIITMDIERIRIGDYILDILPEDKALPSLKTINAWFYRDGHSVASSVSACYDYDLNNGHHVSREEAYAELIESAYDEIAHYREEYEFGE